MEIKESESKPVKRRLDSIDALRAAALFGILLVHAAAAFGWSSMEKPILFSVSWNPTAG